MFRNIFKNLVLVNVHKALLLLPKKPLPLLRKKSLPLLRKKRILHIGNVFENVRELFFFLESNIKKIIPEGQNA